MRLTWFSDRIEILSPGGPYGQVNLESFPASRALTDYRNPHVAEAMKNLGYVQRFSFGIPLARQEMAKNETAARAVADGRLRPPRGPPRRP